MEDKQSHSGRMEDETELQDPEYKSTRRMEDEPSLSRGWKMRQNCKIQNTSPAVKRMEQEGRGLEDVPSYSRWMEYKQSHSRRMEDETALQDPEYKSRRRMDGETNRH